MKESTESTDDSSSLRYEESGGDEPPTIVELVTNGTTRCDRETGRMVTTINNTKCTRTCTEEHEADHRAYRGACCATYAAARRAAIEAGDTARRNTLTSRYNTWVRTTSDFSECRAYGVSVACAERLESEQNCSTITDANRTCCSDVSSYTASVRRSRDARCPGADQSCPDFSA